MIIDISKVTEGKQYNIESKVDFDPNLAEGRELLNGMLKGWYCVTDDIFAVKGEIILTLKGVCDNCLDGIEEEIKVPLSATFTKGNEEEVYHYATFTVDLTQAIEDAVLLFLPNKILCKDDCKGLCPKCGKNLNYESCDCCESELGANNPFYILKSNVGGVKDGITKKKNF